MCNLLCNITDLQINFILWVRHTTLSTIRLLRCVLFNVPLYMVCWCVLFNVPLDNLSLIWRLGSVNEKLNFYFTAGEILATADLSQHTVPGYDLFVYVYDGNTLVGPRTLTVIISGKTSLITKKYKNYVVTRLVSHIIKIMVVFCINSGFLCLVFF